jgi:hypothetical protein
MTSEQILEAQKLVAGIKDDLSLIAGTTDPDKLYALVEEKREPLLGGKFYPLGSLIKSVKSLAWNHILIMNELLPIMAYSGDIQRRSDHSKERLVEIVAEHAPFVKAELDKMAEVLNPLIWGESRDTRAKSVDIDDDAKTAGK